MDNIEKDIEFGILRNKVIRWVEPDFEIHGGNTERSVNFNNLIKWYKRQRNKRYYHRNTMEFLVDFYVINWAWIDD